MIKKLLTILSLLFLPSLVLAFTASEITNNGAPSQFVYKQEFDQLVLDVVIPSGIAGQSDILQALTIQSSGTIRDFYDVKKFVLWSDNTEEGFDGMGVDNKLGEFTFHSDSFSWYIDNLNVEVPVAGLRLFISVETSTGPTSSRFFKMRISGFRDDNQNKQYDRGDLGVCLASGNNGPTDAVVVNLLSQQVRVFVVDDLAPKAVVSVPLNNQVITVDNYTIEGLLKDQGGSNIAWLKLGIAPSDTPNDITWYDISLTSSVGTTEQAWQYQWQDIAEGTYILKVKSADTNYGEATSLRTVTVVVDFPDPDPEPEPDPIPDPEPEPEPTPDPIPDPDPTPDPDPEPEPEEPTEPEEPAQDPVAILRAQIEIIQQQIVALITQLIELLTTQLGL